MAIHRNTSKFLSLILRHQPEIINVEPDAGGWVEIDELVEKMRTYGHQIDRTLLEKVVAESDKQRFAIDPTGKRIRANQGHSIPVDLGLVPVRPPEVLYHGTATRYRESILRTGLDKRARHHVHLSADKETASIVGTRHGKLLIFVVAAGEMYEQGHAFYCSANNVWLTDHVPAQYLEEI